MAGLKSQLGMQLYQFRIKHGIPKAKFPMNRKTITAIESGNSFSAIGNYVAWLEYFTDLDLQVQLHDKIQYYSE
jgi:hypothetical protein